MTSRPFVRIPAASRRPMESHASAWLLLLPVLACSLLLRTAYLSELSPTYGLPDMDVSSYEVVARNITGGDWLGGREAKYLTTPALSYFLALFHVLFGPAVFGLRLLQLLVGASSIVLIYLVGRWVFGHKIGLVAALLSAGYGPALFYEGTVGTAGWLIPLTTFALAGVLWADRRGTIAAWTLAGMALAVLGLLRPNALVLLPLTCVWIAATRRSGGRVPGDLLACLAGAALLFAPMVLRHIYAAPGDVSSIAGLHFYIGNNPTATGTYVVVPGVRPSLEGHVRDGTSIAEHAQGRPLSPFEVSRYWFGRAFRFIWAEPGRFLRLLGTKLRLALSDAEIHIPGYDFQSASRSSAVLRLPLLTFGMLCPLALLGLWLTLRRSPDALLLHLFFAGYLASLCLFFVTGRYRLPLVPPVLLYSAFSLVWLWDSWCERNLRRCAAAMAAMLVVVLNLLPGEAQAPTPTSHSEVYKNGKLYKLPAGCPPKFADGSGPVPPPFSDFPVAGTTFTGWWMGAEDFETEVGGVKHKLTIDTWCLTRPRLPGPGTFEFFKAVATVEWVAYGKPAVKKQKPAITDT